MVCGHGRVVDVEMRDGLELLKPQSFGGAVQDHHVLEEVRRCPTLPHPTECSTIGAEGLSFRVRNGAGRFPSAMAAVTLRNNTCVLSQTLHSGREPADAGFCCCYTLFIL